MLRHGTAGAYSHGGCRCRECTKAASARAWAASRRTLWKTPLRQALDRVFCGAASVTCAGVAIPAHALLEALRRNEDKIKAEALAITRGSAEAAS